MVTVYNPSANTAVEIEDFGMTIPANSAVDIGHIRRRSVKYSTELRGYISNSILKLVRESGNFDTYWSIPDAMEIIENGVNGNQVGLAKTTRPGIVDGQYYGPVTDGTLAVDTLVADHLAAVPVNYMDVIWNRIGISVATGVANGVCRLGIYTNDGGKPGALILDAGFVPTDTTGDKEITIDFEAPTDWYWLVAISNVAVDCKVLTSMIGAFGAVGTATDDVVRHMRASYTYGPLPATFANAISSTEYPPFIWLRRV